MVKGRPLILGLMGKYCGTSTCKACISSQKIAACGMPVSSLQTCSGMGDKGTERFPKSAETKRRMPPSSLT